MGGSVGAVYDHFGGEDGGGDGVGTVASAATDVESAEGVAAGSASAGEERRRDDARTRARKDLRETDGAGADGGVSE